MQCTQVLDVLGSAVSTHTHTHTHTHIHTHAHTLIAGTLSQGALGALHTHTQGAALKKEGLGHGMPLNTRGLGGLGLPVHTSTRQKQQ